MAENGYITQEQADASKKKPIVTARPAAAGPIGRAVLHRRGAQVSRAEVRRQERFTKPGLSVQTGIDIRLQRVANHAVDRGSSGRRQAPRVSPRQAERRRAGPECRDLSPRALEPADCGGRHRACSGGECLSDFREGSRRASRSSSSAGTRLPGRAARPRRCSKSETSSTSASSKVDASGADRVGLSRAVAAARRRPGRHRQSHRADSRDGRRLQLRAQQVQSRDAGPPAGGVAVQAVRVHRGDRSRVHADLGHRRRAGGLQRRRRSAALHAEELRREIRRRDHPQARARGFEERAGGQDDGGADAPAGDQLRAPVRPRVEAGAVSVARAGCGRPDAARYDVGVLRLPERRSAHAAVPDPENLGPRRQPARGKPLRTARCHPRRHRIRDDESAARRRAARHGGIGGKARMAARRQDRHDR